MLFNTEKTQKLLDKSGEILDVFRKTAADLKNVNQEIDAENELLEKQRLEIESKQNSLSMQKIQNERVAAKITQFIEE